MNVIEKPKFDGLRTEPTEGYEPTVKAATKTLKPYQAAAVETIGIHRRVILSYPPGLGKTLIMGQAAAEEIAFGGKVMIVVPPALTLMWLEDTLEEFPHLRVEILKGQKLGPIPDCDVLIVGDSLTSSRLTDLVLWDADGLFVDESHRNKSADSSRTQALIVLADSLDETAIVCLGTGTLNTNTIGDTYTQLRITGKHNAIALSGEETWSAFVDMWAETITAWKKKIVVGCKDGMLELMRKRLLEICMLNVDRAEVLDLPDRKFIHESLELENHSTYTYAEKQFLEYMKETYGKKAAERAGKAKAMTRIMRLWELDALLRAKSSASYIAGICSTGEQVVVFGHHTSVINKIADNLEARGLRVGKIVGGVSTKKKNALVAEFQAGNLDVVIGQVEAAGVGITLTAACHLVFVQMPWSPAAFAQASDRVYRIGQVRPVTVHVLCNLKTVSVRVWNIVSNKAIECDAVNNGKPTTISSQALHSASGMIQAVIQTYEDEV